VKDTISETIILNTTVSANSIVYFPIIPSTIAIGKNTDITAEVVAITANPISDVASLAASIADLPIWRCLTIFSITTMASSINSPTARDSAINDIEFREKFMNFIQVKVLITEIGSDNALISVLSHSFKNRNTIIIANIHPSIIVCITSFTLSSIEVELSLTMSTCTPSGAEVFISSITFLTSLATSTVFAPDCLTISIPIAWFPW